MRIPTIEELFDLSHSKAGSYLRGFRYVYEALNGLRDMIEDLGPTLLAEGYEQLAPYVWVSREARIDPSAHLGPYTVIGARTEVRPGAYLRGDVLVGEDAVIGNSTELKGAILFDGVQVPHYNYVGDSVLGYRAHMGAGSIASNFRSDKGEIILRCEEQQISTGRRKLGTALGDFAEIGCNAVLCPGSFVGRESIVYPLSCVRGVIPHRHIYKGEGVCVERKEKER